MLNKKAIAAFAAGATLLSGLAAAAPALAENTPAKAAATQAAPKADDAKIKAAQKALNLANYNEDKAEDTLAEAQKKLNDAKTKHDTAEALVNAYKEKAKAYDDAKKASDGEQDAVKKAQLEVTTTQTKVALEAAITAAQGNADLKLDTAPTAEKHEADAYKDKLTALKPAENLQTAVYTAQGKLTEAQAAVKTAQDTLNALLNPAPVNPAPVNPAPVNPAPVNPAPKVDPYKNVKPADLEHAKALMGQLEGEQKHFADAQAAADTAAKAVDTAKAAFEKAAGAALSAGAVKPGYDSINGVNFNYDFLSDFQYGKLTPEQKAAYDPFLAAAKDYANKVNASNAAAGAKKSADEKVRSLKLELKKLGVAVDGETPAPKPPVTPPAPKPTPNPEPKPGKVVAPKTKEELKAYVEQVKAYVKSEKDAKKAEAAKKALEEFVKAAKAKDKAAVAAAMKKLLGLVPYTKPASKPEPKPTEPSLVDPKATDLLYKNYQGLFADLAARGVTNVAAYDALLDKLQFGLKQTGWENILKNFGGNNCAYLNGLRRQLQKAVLHYGHVEAAVKDMVAELNEDFKDAQAHHDWDAAKVIDQKLGKADGLLKIADNNRTRAAALLDSANDHAKDLSCDTGAKEVRDAMDKEPNSPFKPAPAPKPAPKTPKAPKLPNTGAVVALAAVAASVLAGMGAALRKIRH